MRKGKKRQGRQAPDEHSSLSQQLALYRFTCAGACVYMCVHVCLGMYVLCMRLCVCLRVHGVYTHACACGVQKSTSGGFISLLFRLLIFFETGCSTEPGADSFSRLAGQRPP